MGQSDAPLGITLDQQGNVYVADEFGNRVAKYDASGNYLGEFGVSGLGKLSDPFDVAVGPSGDVLVSDLNDNRVVEFDASGNYLLQIASQGDWPGQKRPVGVAFDATGNIFVTDNDGRIQEFDSAGNFVTSFGGLPINEGAFEELDHVTFDTAGQALVADGYHQVVDVFSVPEPAAISVLSIGGLAMLRYRRTD